MNKEERAKKAQEKQEEYYSLRNDLGEMKFKLNRLRKEKGRSRPFMMLNASIDLMLYQVESDYNRYIRRIRIADSSDTVIFMQKALNREKEKNAILEKKIEEAKTSSGLFIDFVREKLGFK